MSTFPADGGRMGEAIRTKDWSDSALGDPDSWPLSLRFAVRTMLAQRHAICLFWGPDLCIVYNDAYAPILGLKEKTALGQPFRTVWSEVWTELLPFVTEALAGNGTWSEEMPLILNRNGFDEETFWTFSYSPVYDNRGRIAGIINVALDATGAVVSRRNQEVLQRELEHRVKNTMAVVSAVVTSSLRHAASLEDGRRQVSERITALSKAHDLLLGMGDTAHVEQIVMSGISAYLDRPERLAVAGPTVIVASQQAVGLSLAIHELATNAAKYGALSVEKGTVAISWHRGDDNAFHFTWEERGGPQVVAPTRTGFGTRLTNSIVANYFSGEGKTHYHPDGVRFELRGKLESAEEDQ